MSNGGPADSSKSIASSDTTDTSLSPTDMKIKLSKWESDWVKARTKRMKAHRSLVSTTFHLIKFQLWNELGRPDSDPDYWLLDYLGSEETDRRGNSKSVL